MRHILSKSVRKHVELIASVPKMLNPLHLVATIVDKTLIKKGELLESSHHHIGFKNTLLETLQSGVLSALRQISPVVR